MVAERDGGEGSLRASGVESCGSESAEARLFVWVVFTRVLLCDFSEKKLPAELFGFAITHVSVSEGR